MHTCIQVHAEAIARREKHAARLKGRRARIERRRQMRASGSPSAAAEAESDSEASDQEERSASLALAQAAALQFQYFHAHEQGKVAVRLWAESTACPLPDAGIHGFSRLSGDHHTCEGPGAPVILHYACCGYANWRRKYEMLTTDPRVKGARQASLGELAKTPGPTARRAVGPRGHGAKRAAHGATQPEGARGLEPQTGLVRDADQLIAVHALSAQLFRSGDESEAFSLYTRTICMPDVVPLLASRGLLLAIDFPCQLIMQLRQRRKFEGHEVPLVVDS